MDVDVMTIYERSTRTLRRWSNPVAAMLLIGASQAVGNKAHADPGDFQAMPGLWKITMHMVKEGKSDQVVVKWRCFDEGSDPWVKFVDVLVPDPQCQRSGEHRISTSLAWNATCPGTPVRNGHGHIDLDSPQHFTGDVALNGKDAMTIEGQRYAACTGPSD
jgi:hypothetical protein